MSEEKTPLGSSAPATGYASTRWIKYRVVRDNYAGYEVQTWRWYFPFWVQGKTNTHQSVEAARRYALNISQKEVWDA